MIYQLLSVLVIINIPGIYGLIGYDCGAKYLNVTTLSLRDVGECEIPDSPINTTLKYVQLLQLNEYKETPVIQCKVEVHRTVYYCGAFSHVSLVMNGENEYLYEVSRAACQNLHEYGIFRLSNHIIEGVKVNETSSHSVLLAGTISEGGKCDGTGYSDYFGSWQNVIVQGIVKITLSTYNAQVKLDNDQLMLLSGTTCPLSARNCIDSEGGYTFWKPIPTDTCNFNRYGILYEGLANKMIDADLGNKIVYSVATQGVTFALTAKGQESVCGYQLTTTEHPKLIIFETEKGNTFASATRTSVSNLDIFAYVNSKFIYVEKHLRTQMKQLYRDTLIQRCNLERQTLKNSLSIAKQSPDDFAFDLMKGPGYMGVAAGEVVHIVKCIPVDVRVEHGDSCYSELQVFRNNQTFFLTPRTHILKQTGIRVPCNNLLPSYYYLADNWYKILPKPTQAIAPMILKPMSKPTWSYINPADLAISGIYSDTDLEQLRERIMFPMERPGLLNDLAREMRGHPVNFDDSSISKLLNPDALDKLVHSTWERMWSKFMWFGSASAGVVGIVMIFQFIKALINIIIHGYTLHSVYGWSIRLLGAFFGSITHLLVHLRTNDNNNNKNDNNPAPMELIVHTPEKPSTSDPNQHLYPVREVTAETQKPFFNVTA